MNSRRLPLPHEIQRFATDALNTMMDTCIVLRFGDGEQDDHGIPSTGYVAGEPTPCGFGTVNRREVRNGAQIVIATTQLRLPLSEAVAGHDLIRLTHRLRQPLAAPEVYEITSLRQGIGQWLLELKRAQATQDDEAL